MRVLIAIAAIYLIHVNAHAIPACTPKVKEELSRHGLDWKKSEREKADSSAMEDEYHTQQDLINKIENSIPDPDKPLREKFKTYSAYKKAVDEWKEAKKEAGTSRTRILLEKNPDYKSASAIVDKYKEPGNDFFYDYVRSGLTGFDEILYFPTKAKAKVVAYVQNGRVQGYRSVQANGDRDSVLFDGDCGIDAVTIHHAKLIDLVRTSLCDDLGKLKSLVARAAANPAVDDEDVLVEDACKEQGGEFDGQVCRCPGMSKGKMLLAEIDPTSDTCFDERVMSDGQRLMEFAVASESSIEPSLDSYVATERVCKRYYGVSVKSSSAEPAPAKTHK